MCAGAGEVQCRWQVSACSPRLKGGVNEKAASHGAGGGGGNDLPCG